MKKSCNYSPVKKTLLFILAGMAAVKLAQEVPAMVRYYKMKRL